jgi:CDP-diacylglycerol--glycerol-3-phosphate 3-phosphatidyltransferase
MISSIVADRVRGRLHRVGELVARTRLSPNWLTVIGFLLNLGVALVFASGHLRLAGVLALLAGAFDMLDGAVARATRRVTRFGGFLDSTLDRYSEALLFGGLLVHILRADLGEVAVLLCYATIVGSLMVSYARARAEAAGIPLTAGLFARPERIVALALFLLLDRPVWVLWLLAIATNLTVLQRTYLMWRRSRALDQPKQPGAPRG